MTQYIRWWGLGVFVLLVALLVGGTILFADLLVQRAVESIGTRVNGAKVELQSANMAFDPFGFTLNDVQVTDAREPMRNAVQIQRVKFALDGFALLRRKVVITDMNVEGVRTNTPRTTSGAIPKAPEPEPEQPGESLFAGFELPKVDLPDAKDILDKETLQTTQLAEKLRAELDQAKEKWNQRVAQLPDEAKFKGYEERIKQAKPSLEGNLQQDIEELKDGIKRLETVRDDVRTDVEQVKEAKQALETDWQTWSRNTKALTNAPGEDLDRLKSKYSLDAKGFSNISRALFGAEIAAWSDTAFQWYGKIKPVLEHMKSLKSGEEVKPQRWKGVDIRFPERDRLPAFLIRSTKVSLEVPAGTMRGEIRNITNDQATLGHPLTFNFFAEKMHGVQDIELEGTLNHVDPAAAVDTVRFKAHGVQIERFALVRQKSFPVTLSDALVNLDSSAELKGSALTATGNAAFKTVKLGADVGASPNELEKVMVAALADVQHFDINARLTGTLKKYDIDLASDLDELLRDALNRQFRQRVDQFIADVKARIDEKVQEARKQIDARLAELKKYEDVIEQRRKQGEEMLAKAEQEARAAVDKQKTELERQKQEAEAKVKKEVDAEKKKAEDKARKEADKLKGKLKDQIKF